MSPAPYINIVDLAPRALGSITTTPNVLTPTATSGGAATLTSPLFSPPTNTASDGDQSKPDLAKSILERLFAVAAVIVVVGFLIWRYTRVRGQPTSVRGFFGLSSPGAGNTSLSSNRSTRYPTDPVLRAAAQAAVRRRTRGADIDVGGRRGVDGNDKDELPAYDNNRGPPKYAFDSDELPENSIEMVTLPEHRSSVSDLAHHSNHSEPVIQSREALPDYPMPSDENGRRRSTSREDDSPSRRSVDVTEQTRNAP